MNICGSLPLLSNCHFSYPKSTHLRAIWISSIVIALLGCAVISLSAAHYLPMDYGLPAGFLTLVFSAAAFLSISCKKNRVTHQIQQKPELTSVKKERVETVYQEGLLALPEEVLLHILGCVQPIDLWRLRGVGRTFQRLADEEKHWENACLRINTHLGEKRAFLGLRTRVEKHTTWQKSWVEAQKESQLSLTEGSCFLIKGGHLFNFSHYTGTLRSLSCGGDYRKREFALNFPDLSLETAVFSLYEERGIITDGTALYLFDLDSQQTTLLSWEEPGEEAITALYLMNNGHFLTGSESGTLQEWCVKEDQCSLVNTFPIAKKGKVVEIKATSEWIVFKTENEKSTSIYGYRENGNALDSFPIRKTDRSSCFDLFDHYLIIGNDDGIALFDLPSQERNIPFLTQIFPFAEIHALEIEGDILNIAYTPKGVACDDEGGQCRWITMREQDFLSSDPTVFIPIALYNCSLNPLKQKLLEAIQNRNTAITI